MADSLNSRGYIFKVSDTSLFLSHLKEVICKSVLHLTRKAQLQFKNTLLKLQIFPFLHR